MPSLPHGGTSPPVVLSGAHASAATTGSNGPAAGNEAEVSGPAEVAKALCVGAVMYASGRLVLRALGVSEVGAVDRHQWAAKGMKVLHSTVSSTMGYLCACGILAASPAASYQSASNTLLTRVVWWELGYYIYDTLVDTATLAMKKKQHGAVDLLLVGFQLHHMVPICSSFFYSTYRARATRATDWVVSAALFSNFSTIFQHTLWIFDKAGVRKTSAAYRAVLLAFLSSFVALRQFGLVWLLRAFSGMRIQERVEAGSEAAGESTPSVAHAWAAMPVKCRTGTIVLSILNLVWLVLNLKNKVRPSFFPRSAKGGVARALSK
eukprot:Rhum_TRINITY_DN14783_c10_g2::Rhum_TRINITY_DN14783_c10_g2_i1::g.118706::m.118706